jgi:hypothetical protein
LPAFDKTPQPLEGGGTAIAYHPDQKFQLARELTAVSNPQLVALVTPKGLQFLAFSYLWDFFRFWGIAQLMSGLSNERASQWYGGSR